jgi:hypothetical protein
MTAKVALVTALLSVAFVQSQDSPRVTQANAPDVAANLVRIHNAWGPRASTPNTSLAIKEASRSGNVIKFRLYATGLPKGGNYTIVHHHMRQRREAGRSHRPGYATRSRRTRAPWFDCVGWLRQSVRKDCAGAVARRGSGVRG